MFLSWEWPKAEIPYNICDLILNSVDNNPYKKGEVLDSDVQPIRDVNIQFNNINWINALLSGYIRYANYENFPSTTIHFLEANYTTPLGISTVLKNHFISVLPDSHREKYANLPFSLYAHFFRLD